MKADNLFIIFDKVATPTAATKKSFILDPGGSPVSAGINAWTVTNGSGMMLLKSLPPSGITTSVESPSASQFKETITAPTTEGYFVHVLEAKDAGIPVTGFKANSAQISGSGGTYTVTVGGNQLVFTSAGGFTFIGGVGCTPTTEICDGQDNDCDGQADEGGVCGSIPSDFNNDGVVDVTDLGVLLSAWGAASRPPADINQNGAVDVTDLGILLSHWS